MLEVVLYMLLFVLVMLLMFFVGCCFGCCWLIGRLLVFGFGVVVFGNFGIVLVLWWYSDLGLLLLMVVLGSGGGLFNGEM